MRSFIILALTIFSIPQLKAQQGFGVSFGGVSSYLQFAPFEQFVTSYNNQFASNPSTVEPLSYNPFGTGIEGSFQYRIGPMYSAIKIGKTVSFESVAKFESGERAFKFRNNAFDVVVGFTIKKLISPYITLTINSMNIDTYFRYNNGFESYGSERMLSGIYSSNKLYSAGGLRIEKQFNRLGFYIDASVPFIAKKYLGDTFNKQNNATDAPYFPLDNSTYGNLVVDDALPQTYRNMRLSLGLVIYLTKAE